MGEGLRYEEVVPRLTYLQLTFWIPTSLNIHSLYNMGCVQKTKRVITHETMVKTSFV